MYSAKEELKKHIISGIVGLVVGLMMAASGLYGEGVYTYFLATVLFTGIPYGWKLSEKVVGGIFVVGSVGVIAVACILRFLFAVVVGWIAYPIKLIVCIINIVRESKM